MKPRRDRKALAVIAVPVVIMLLRKPTVMRAVGRNRTAHRRETARLRGCRVSPFCTAKAVPTPNPIARTGPNANVRSIWRYQWLKKS
jgi:hypothetical protein